MYAEVLFPINAESFTYLVPDELQQDIKIGCRVRAPFKRSEKTGVVVALNAVQTAKPRQGSSGFTAKKITFRPLKSLIDEEPFLYENMLDLIQWVGEYYMSTSGLALKNAVPSAFFTGRKAGVPRINYGEVPKKIADLVLTADQERALEEINKAEQGVFLLHGVTGSGKTEVYIRAIQALQEEKEAILLVPEIAITAQMIDRFRGSFGDKVVFFHSGLSPGERITQWQSMRGGQVKVVIGVRSAVYAPLRNVGIIIIDEEQEASYKQFEGLRYNARDVALARAQFERIKIILGSATPSLEAYYMAKKGAFTYLQLEKRIEQRALPDVDILDMTRAEKKSFSLSVSLTDSLKETLSRGHQSVIMLNRRGYSSFFICADCGYTYKCPACSITLIYHKDTNTLNCHYCGSFLHPKALCPDCKGTNVKYLGAGTQRVEEDLRFWIPELSFQRMDRDTTRRKLSHYRIVKQMENKEIDVLLGTQMVAKGHDFPDVALAAVISADIALNLPDFRSAERAFQLFTQLAGRAGRGDVPGRAIIQTYEPEHYVFDYVRYHDYAGFYDREVQLRKDLSYPPFSRLLRIILNFRTKEAGKKSARTISERIGRLQQKGIVILGPAPAPIEKIKHLWRWHIILKGKRARELRQAAGLLIGRMKNMKEIKIDVDVDPINML